MNQKKWKKIINYSQKIENLIESIGTISYWIVIFMVIISAYNAIVRYLGKYLGFNLSNNAFIEMQWYSFSIIFLLGGAYALKHNAHVRVDIVYHNLPDKIKTYINILGTIFFLIPFCFLIIIVSIPSVVNSWMILEGSPDPGGLPRYPLKTLIPVSFFLLFLQGISFLIKNITHLKMGLEIDEEKQISEKVL